MNPHIITTLETGMTRYRALFAQRQPNTHSFTEDVNAIPSLSSPLYRFTGDTPPPPNYYNPLFDEIWLPWAENVQYQDPTTTQPLPNNDDGWFRRTIANDTFSYAIPTLPLLRKIIQYSPHGLAEIGAGSGYWSHLLSVLGLDVIGIDNFSDIKSPLSKGEDKPLYFPVEKADGVEFIASGQAGRRTLFFCWPRALFGAEDGFGGFEGDTIVCIGVVAGSTSDIRAVLVGTEKWEVVEEVEVPCWKGIQDVCFILKRIS
ncbi:hypothetical protein HDV00_006296 [Rhizophlyctis rosea]|nr:hypothetical protein HDV00_006296 [Rhizophlyctis rosea]